MANSTIQQPAETQQSFEEQARRMLSAIRVACSGLIASLSQRVGRSVETPTDLQRTLGIRSTLAWQVYRVATATDPIQELDAIPGSTAIKRVTEAARSLGVTAAAIDELTTAVQAFDEFVREHAGTRKTFNSLVAAMGDKTDDSLDSQYRREAFHANSHIWGVRARQVVQTMIILPGQTNTRLWSVSAMSKIGVQRLRTDVPFRICAKTTYSGMDDGPVPPKPLIAGGHALPALLPEFTTNPLPPVETVDLDGEGQVLLGPGPVGKAGTADFVSAGVGPESTWIEKDKPVLKITTIMSAPAESLVQDMLIHTSMFDRLQPQAHVHLDLDKGPMLNWIDPPEHTRQVAKHKPAFLGTGVAAARVQEFPRYAELLEFLCGQLGWNPADFDVYRCRVEYPILFGMYRMRFDLPEKGNW